MDPPSFTRKICREKLNNISEADLNSMQGKIVEKALKINQKLPEAYRLPQSNENDSAGAGALVEEEKKTQGEQ